MPQLSVTDSQKNGFYYVKAMSLISNISFDVRANFTVFAFVWLINHQTENLHHWSS